jgi:hypothetical protein
VSSSDNGGRRPQKGKATAAVALLHSPLLDARSWGRTAEVLSASLNTQVLVPEVVNDQSAPYGESYVREAGRQVATAMKGPIMLIGHSGAGCLLPLVGATVAARGEVVAGYVFCDASLPGAPGQHRLDLVRNEDPSHADMLEARLRSGARYPEWTEESLTPLIASQDARRVLLSGMRPRGLDFFLEPLPHSPGWIGDQSAYLRLSDGYARSAELARRGNWPACAVPLGHLGTLVSSTSVAAALDELVRALTGSVAEGSKL